MLSLGSRLVKGLLLVLAHFITDALTFATLTDQDSFFKPHKDASRGEMMFGSLVIVLPTPQKGGGFVLRHYAETLHGKP